MEEQHRNWRSPQPPAPRPALTPVQAFLALLVLAVAGGSVFALTGTGDGKHEASSKAAPSNGAGAGTSPTAPPLSAPTEAEALTIFTDLKVLLHRSYARRLPALVGRYALEGSPEATNALRQIRFLRRNSLLDRTRDTTLESDVTVIAPDEIVIVERSFVRPLYLDDATTLPVELDVRARRVTIEWTLRAEGEAFKIYSALRR